MIREATDSAVAVDESAWILRGDYQLPTVTN